MENKKDPEVIVSMTSFPAAIDYAVESLKSILKGSVLPDRIILYLTFSQFGDKGLPDELLELERKNPIFEIRDYPYDIRSYRKLVPALEDFPESIIVTVDDDINYHEDMLKLLLDFHKKEPYAVLAHRAKWIKLDMPYKKWKKVRWYHFITKKNYEDPLIMQTGVAGVLYPPHILKEDMLDKDLFTKIAPTTDDIWFWAATVANGHLIMPVPFGKNKPKGLKKPKDISLKTVNFKKGEDRNSKALHDIMKAFPDLRDKLITLQKK